MLRFFRELPTSPVRFFVVVTIIFGPIFLLATPPLQGADETVHFLRAYQISEFDIVSDKNGSEVGGFLPSSVGDTVNEINPNSVTFKPGSKYQVSKTRNALSLDGDSEKFYSFPGGSTYSPASYAGASPAMFFARILSLPSIVVFYAGRLGTLCVWIALVAVAIAAIPRRKWLFVFIGLLPMALFQATTINGDAVTIGTLMLFIGLILKYRDQKNPLSNRALLGLLLISLVMVLSKQAMFIFLPLVLLLRKQSFESRRIHILAKVGLILLPLISCVIWAYVVRDVSNISTGTNGENSTAQLKFIIKNPHSFINVLWNTHFYTWGDNITRSMVGTFGWSDTPLSVAIVSIAYIGGAFIALGVSDVRDRLLMNNKEKILLLILGLAYWGAVNASLYVYYSPVGYKIVYGLQGRYFIPLLVILLPFIATKKIRIEPALYKKMTTLLPVFLLIASTITIFVRYYVNNV